jgi:pimeloyl-ACP methyl ester carboxylesterase
VVAEKGKDDPELDRTVITPLVSAGWHVVAIDVRGWGETTPYMPERQTRADGTKIRMAWDEFFAYRSLELGRPLFGQRLRDTLVAASDLSQPEIAILGTGAGALLAVYAAVLEPRFRTVVSIGALLSYRSLIDDPLQRHPTSILLPGVLRAYDLPDVYAAIAGRRLLVINPQDPKRIPVARGVAGAALGWTEQVFRAAGSQKTFSVHCDIADGELPGNLAQWLRP